MSTNSSQLNITPVLQLLLLNNFDGLHQLRNIKSRFNSTVAKENICGLNDSTKSLLISFLARDITKPIVIVTSSV
ncbi:MAG: hypothetical protein AB7V50_08360, partial [Vampirovibrionia bacterium]